MNVTRKDRSVCPCNNLHYAIGSRQISESCDKHKEKLCLSLALWKESVFLLNAVPLALVSAIRGSQLQKAPLCDLNLVHLQFHTTYLSHSLIFHNNAIDSFFYILKIK